MPTISKIRLTNVVYDGGQKRYLDTVFRFDGHNGLLLLENGAGKTVFVQTVVQAVLPHAQVARRRIQDTLLLSNSIAHVAVEWIISERPRRYALTMVSLFLNSQDQLASQKFVAEYGEDAELDIEKLPLTQTEQGRQRPSSKEELAAFCRRAAESSMTARFFSENETLTSYARYLEEHFQLVEAEWRRIAVINETEGGVEAFFENCRTTAELTNRLLIPVVEEGMAPERQGDKKQNDFADLFISQREHLRKQLQVEKSLQEIQGVERELAVCTAQRQKQQQAEGELAETSGVLKAYYQVAAAAREKTEQNVERLELRQQELAAALASTRQELAACRVAKDRQRYEACRAEAMAAGEEAEAAAAEAESIQLALDNLQYAAKRDDHRQAVADAGRLTAELEQQRLRPEAAELAEQLEENGRALGSWFAAEEERLGRRQAELRAEMAEREQELEAARQGLKVQEGALLRAEQALSSQDGQVKILQQQKEQQEQMLFPNSMQNSPEEQVKSWQAEQAQEKAALAAGERDSRFYREEGEKSRQRLAEVDEELGQARSDLAATRKDMAVIDNECGHILPLLSRSERLLGLANDTASLYQQSTYITGQLEDSQVFLRQEKEQLATRHRLACHLLDRYGGLQEFAAEPLLEEIVAELAPDFVYLQSGAALYRQYRAELTADELQQRYPWWAITLVTDAADLPRLEQRLQSWRDRLTEPLLLASDQEIRAFVAGNAGTALPVRPFLPGLWQSLETDYFQSWLQGLRERAAETAAHLQAKERELREAEELAVALGRLLREHPVAEFRELAAAEKRLVERESALLQEQAREKEQQETCRLNLEKLAELMLAQREKIAALQQSLQSAEHYFDLHRQHLAALEAGSRLRAQRDRCQQDRAQAQLVVDKCADLMTECRLALSRQESELQQLREKDFYREVQGKAVGTAVTESYRTLAEMRRSLQIKLQGLDESRLLLEEKLRQAERDAARLAGELEALRRGAAGVLDEEMAYPSDGEAQLRRLEERRQAQQGVVRTTAQKYRQKQSLADKAEANWERSLDDYRAAYQSEPAPCPEPQAAGERLAARLAELQQSLEAVRQAARSAQEELKRLQALLSEMEKANIRFAFLADLLKEAILPREELTAAELQRRVAELLPQEEKLFQHVEELREKTRRMTDGFVRFCEKTVTQERYRRMLVDGIRSKESYAEYLEWQTSMVERINSAIRVWEGERDNHAKEVDSIIRQIEMHLAEVCHGLKEVAAKTRLRTTAGTKDVYTVQLPAWNQAEARAAIRQQLHELSQRLEMDEFKNEQGLEDTGKIKRELERQLTSQSLLRRILGEHAIKVKCRKATNKATFSEHPYSWEESNRWSGGEMWSKNMALFLGCLNYLAEKRGGRRQQGQAPTRTVLADNPFGKASSEHILQPVFFIAQQLGFQIIALTAHEDGSFIRSFFPVLYSCKFRPLAAGRGTVLTPECQLQMAFFADKDPEAMERLTGPAEQGSLF